MGLALALNALLCGATFTVYFESGSQLILAHGSDSLMDLAAGAILYLSVTVGRRPGDASHPHGHQRAEPIGALVAAVLAGVLGVEVLRSALGALWAGEVAELDLPVAAVLGAKLLLKAGFLAALWRAATSGRSSALDATRVDTRNDVLVCASSLVGWGVARAGFGWADAALAIPVGLYVLWAGVELARANLRFLMGESADRETVAELVGRVAAVPDVLEVTSLAAIWDGPLLLVHAAVRVPRTHTATEGHDLALGVQRELESHPLVARAFVHVDTADALPH